MEKRKPTYDLESFKTTFIQESSVCATKSAVENARSLGFTLEDMEAAVESMERSHFYKSMTSYADHSLWQDVYHTPFRGLVLYIKFTEDRITEFRLLSFKEK